MKVLFLLLLSTMYLNCFAQDVGAFKSQRYEEDYSFLKDDTSNNWYKKTKYKPFTKNKDAYLSMGGDIRLQYFLFKNENWGKSPEDKDGFLLTRWLAHVDYHANKYFRVFAQLQSSQVNGKASTSPVDENPLEIHQAFFDLNILSSPKSNFTFRIGRQELGYGSQRLISVREGPNNRQSFDGLKGMYTHGAYKTDVFFTHYVSSKKGIFDDGFSQNQKLWGAYVVRNKSAAPLKIDLYYLGLLKRQAKFDDGYGKEIRHSVGSRVWNSRNSLRYDIEGVYQFGTLAGNRISAWTLSLNGGYQFSNVKLKPEIGLKTELISGDRSFDDERLQTFNPLFPRGGYFGLASIIGPANLFDIHPSLMLQLSKKINWNLDYDIFWRYSKNDGIYGPNVVMIYSGKNSDHKHIGRQLSTDLVYTPNGFLYFRGEFTWFKVGQFLKDVGAGKDILFNAVTVQFKF